MKPYYQDEYTTLYCGDCRDLLPTIPANSIDIMFADPPYGHNNNDGDLIHNMEAALGKVKKVSAEQARPIANDGMEDMKSAVDFALVEAARFLKKDCCCCCCCCCSGGGPRPTFAWLANRMDEKGLSFFHAVVWDKGGLGIGWMYRRNYEMVMVAHRKNGKMKWEWKENGKETANVVRIGKIIPTATDHPTPKPIALVEHFLLLHGKPGDVVIDPFMGAGTTIVAARNLGLKSIGCEIDEHWCEVAAKRLSQGVLPLWEKE